MGARQQMMLYATRWPVGGSNRTVVICVYHEGLQWKYPRERRTWIYAIRTASPRAVYYFLLGLRELHQKKGAPAGMPYMGEGVLGWGITKGMPGS